MRLFSSRNQEGRVIPITAAVSSIVLEAYHRYRANALYLERKIESDSKIHINHDRIHRALLMTHSLQVVTLEEGKVVKSEQNVQSWV